MSHFQLNCSKMWPEVLADIISLSWVKLWVLWRPRVVSSYLLASGHPPYKSNNLWCLEMMTDLETCRVFSWACYLCPQKKAKELKIHAVSMLRSYEASWEEERSVKADIASPSGILLASPLVASCDCPMAEPFQSKTGQLCDCKDPLLRITMTWVHLSASLEPSTLTIYGNG